MNKRTKDLLMNLTDNLMTGHSASPGDLVYEERASSSTIRRYHKSGFIEKLPTKGWVLTKRGAKILGYKGPKPSLLARFKAFIRGDMATAT